LSQIFLIPMRLLVNCGKIFPVHTCCDRWGMLISAGADDVITFPLAMLTVIVGAVLLMLDTGDVVMKKCPLEPVSAIAVQVLDMV